MATERTLSAIAKKRLIAVVGLLCLAAGGCVNPLSMMIASTPNRLNPLAGRLNPLPPMESLIADRHLWVDVGPPEATLSVSIIDPDDDVSPKGTILVVHGIGARGLTMYHHARSLAKSGYRIVLPDLRGEGRSTGDFRTYGVLEGRDLSQVIDALEREQLIAGPIGVLGISYGATTSIHLAACDPRVQAVVAVEPFGMVRPEISQFSRVMLPGVGWLIPESKYHEALDRAGRIAGFDPDESDATDAIRLADAPVLLIHGTNDWIVPYWNSVALSEAAPKNSMRLAITGGGHLSLWADLDGSVSAGTLLWFNHWLVAQAK